MNLNATLQVVTAVVYEGVCYLLGQKTPFLIYSKVLKYGGYPVHYSVRFSKNIQLLRLEQNLSRVPSEYSEYQYVFLHSLFDVLRNVDTLRWLVFLWLMYC